VQRALGHCDREAARRLALELEKRTLGSRTTLTDVILVYLELATPANVKVRKPLWQNPVVEYPAPGEKNPHRPLTDAGK
jgi:hypothetical protein